jgi:hypothetical protein
MVFRKYCRGKLLRTKVGRPSALQRSATLVNLTYDPLPRCPVCNGPLQVFFRSFHVTECFCRILRHLVYWIAGIGALLIIGTRLHYTLDVAMAVYITQRTFR